ncbi:hypothetical protein B296_00011143, partial [Ensete ventricosum]
IALQPHFGFSLVSICICTKLHLLLDEAHGDSVQIHVVVLPEIEMMKERFSKLLLGEDMSGCGEGACTALAISNAITNLCGKHFTASHFYLFSAFDSRRTVFFLQPPSSGSYGGWNLFRLRRRPCGEGRWSGFSGLGDVIYRYVASDHFSPECLLDCLDLSSEHRVLEVANRVEASIYIWRRRAATRPASSSTAKSSWKIVKDMIVDADKRELLAERAETLLLCLKQRFPSLTQTSLDTSKIQFNKDIGKSILESYSRVLESLAFNIVARIDDLLHVDDFCKHSDPLCAVPAVSIIAQKKVTVPASGTPCMTAYATPCFSRAPLISPAGRERSPLINKKPSSSRGFGVKKVLTSYLSAELRTKCPIDATEPSAVVSNRYSEISSSS